MAIFVLYFKSGNVEVIEHKSVFSYIKENDIDSDSLDFYTSHNTDTYIFKKNKWIHGDNPDIKNAILDIQDKNSTNETNEEKQDGE